MMARVKLTEFNKTYPDPEYADAAFDSPDSAWMLLPDKRPFRPGCYDADRRHQTRVPRDRHADDAKKPGAVDWGTPPGSTVGTADDRRGTKTIG